MRDKRSVCKDYEDKVMNKPLILVMGATGKTGTGVVEQILKRAYPLRAMVRRIDERSERLAELGAEICDMFTSPSMPSSCAAIATLVVASTRRSAGG